MRLSSETATSLLEGTKQKVALSEKGAAVANEAAAAAESKGQNLAIIQQAADLAKLEVQQRNLQVASAAGITEGADIRLQQHALLLESQQRAAAKAAEVRNMTESTIARDGFFGWLSNTVNLELKQQALKASLDEVTVNQNNLLATNNTVQESTDTNLKLAQTVTRASITAGVEAIRNDATIEASKLKMEGLRHNEAGVDAVMQMSLAQHRLAESTQSSILQLRQDSRAASAEARAVADQKRQDELFSIQKEEAGIRLKLAQFNMKETEQEAELDKDFAAKYKIGLKALGMPDMSPKELEFILSQRRSGKQTAQHELIYATGARTAQNKGTPVYGTKPSEAIQTINTPGVELVEAQQRTLELFEQARKLVPPMIRDGKDDVAKANSFNDQVELLTKVNYQSQINRGSIFDVGNLATNPVLQAPAVANLPIVKKLIGPLAINKQDMSDPQVVIDLTMAALKAGTITSSEAQGISTVYSYANMLNQQQRNFKGLGIRLPEGGVPYRVRLERSDGAVDLTRPEQVQRYMMLRNSIHMGRLLPP
jgi:hypothetical protein